MKKWVAVVAGLVAVVSFGCSSEDNGGASTFNDEPDSEVYEMTSRLVWENMSYSDRSSACDGIDMDDRVNGIMSRTFKEQINPPLDPDKAWDAFVNESRKWC